MFNNVDWVDQSYYVLNYKTKIQIQIFIKTLENAHNMKKVKNKPISKA